MAQARAFGRRASSHAAPPPPAAPAESGPPLADPRLKALAEAARGPKAADPELTAYADRRRAAVGPWRTLAYALVLAPPAAACLLGVHGVWLAPVSLAGALAPGLLKRARLRWATQLEAEARARPERRDAPPG